MLVVAPNIEIAKAYHAHLADFGHETRIADKRGYAAGKKNLDDFKKGKYRILVIAAMA